MFSDAIPHGFNELDTLLDAKAKDFFKLGWTHGQSLRRHWPRCNLRARLAAEILASLDGPVDPDAEQAWQAEIARRVADLEAGKLKLESWAKVKRRIEKSILGR